MDNASSLLTSQGMQNTNNLRKLNKAKGLTKLREHILQDL